MEMAIGLKDVPAALEKGVLVSFTGNPGTGKTRLMQLLIDALVDKKEFEIDAVNNMDHEILAHIVRVEGT